MKYVKRICKNYNKLVAVDNFCLSTLTYVHSYVPPPTASTLIGYHVMTMEAGFVAAMIRMCGMHERMEMLLRT